MYTCEACCVVYEDVRCDFRFAILPRLCIQEESVLMITNHQSNCSVSNVYRNFHRHREADDDVTSSAVEEADSSSNEGNGTHRITATSAAGPAITAAAGAAMLLMALVTV